MSKRKINTTKESSGSFKDDPQIHNLDNIGIAIDELNHISKQLRSYANLVGYFTLFHLGIGIWLIIYTLTTSTKRYSIVYEFRSLFILMEVMFLVCSILILFAYDRKISKGDALYQEISDELEWHVIQDRQDKNEFPTIVNSTRDRPGLSVRLALREFVLATRLPFIRGSQGTAFYLVINILVTLISLITLALKSTQSDF